MLPKNKHKRSSTYINLVVSIILLYFCNGSAFADEPFSSGERITYGAYYNWHFIWVNAGEVAFSADTVSYKGQPAWNFKAIGNTYKAYDLFYSVRDTFESYVITPGFEPLWFRRVINHGKNYSLHQYDFSKAEGLIYSEVKRDGEKYFTGTQEYESNVLDLLSTAYNFRSFNFQTLKKDEKVPFKMMVDNKIENLYFRYLGIDEVKTREGRKFRCHQISVWLFAGDFFPEGEYMKVWLTDDKNKLPIMVETKVQVGSVKAIFLNAEKLKNPLTSEIFD